MEYSRILELYIQYLSGTLSPEEARQVEQWRQNDEDFRRQWEQLEEEGKQMNASSYLESINSDYALQSIKFNRKKSNSKYKFLAAASFLLLLSVAAYWVFENPKTSKSITSLDLPKKETIKLISQEGVIELKKDSVQQTIALKNTTLTTGNGSLQYASTDTAINTLSVPDGQTYMIKLSDGTEVWLNAGSKLRFPFSFVGKRTVSIEGEAFFKVATDAGKPFIVNTPLTTIQVLGTSFNVNTYNAGKVKTALVDGRVKTNNRNGTEEDLKPGMMAEYSQSNGFTTGKFDEEEVLSWRNGIYYYHKMPLANLLDEASRFYGVKFRIESKEPIDRYITGLMDRNRLEDFLSDLKTTASIDFTVKDKEILIRL
ncbi:FecR domain-containing protein [Chitinophaga silvatica]|nr:FecR domain-containing protein [Chitinophaga silvatica]